PAAFLAGALPWSLVALARARVTAASAAARWCAVWIAVVLGFFMAGRISLATYVCPAFVPLALLGGRAWTAARAGRGAVLVWGSLAAFTLVVAVTPAWIYAPLVGRLVYPPWWSLAPAL